MEDQNQEHLASLQRRYEVLQKKINEFANLTPEQIRDKSNATWDMIEDRESFIKEDQEYINKNMVLLQNEQESINKNKDILQEQQDLIDKINKLYDELKKKLNNNQIGSLQGLARTSIKKNNVVANEGDVTAQYVLDEPYDEFTDVNRNNNIGGKKRRIKNKTHKKRKNKNKNKKSRRFNRNK